MSIKSFDNERREANMDRRIAEFINQWGPEDRNLSAQFSAHLISIIRATYSEAQIPVSDIVEKVLMSTNHIPMFKKDG